MAKESFASQMGQSTKVIGMKGIDRATVSSPTFHNSTFMKELGKMTRCTAGEL